nr:MAG TPA: hypothetical protein [Microviridae sp.]
MISAEPHTTLAEWVQFRLYPFSLGRFFWINNWHSFPIYPLRYIFTGESLFHLSRKGFRLISAENSPLLALY